MSEHTKGPWYSVDEDGRFSVYAKPFCRVAVDIHERNAALIAAAPDMLIALKAIRESVADLPDDTWGYDSFGDASVPGGMVSYPIKDRYLHHIDETIAKAEGRS